MRSDQSLVAIVDDDTLLLESLRDLLESAGHTVSAFSSAHAFLDDSSLETVDCLITDIGMPVIDGFELQKLATARKPELPVIFVTGQSDFMAQLYAAELNRGKFFHKPFDAQALLTAVSKALANG